MQLEELREFRNKGQGSNKPIEKKMLNKGRKSSPPIKGCKEFPRPQHADYGVY